MTIMRANLRNVGRSNQTEIVRGRLEKLEMMLRNVAVAQRMFKTIQTIVEDITIAV